MKASYLILVCRFAMYWFLQSSVGRSCYHCVQRKKFLVIFHFRGGLDHIANVIDTCLCCPMSEPLVVTNVSSTIWIKVVGCILGDTIFPRDCITTSTINLDICDPIGFLLICLKMFPSNIKYVHKQICHFTNCWTFHGWSGPFCRSFCIFCASFKSIIVKSAVTSMESLRPKCL